MKILTPRSLVLLSLLCFGLLPPAQAVVPPPDGGYPGGNTAEGQNALLSLSTGTYNTGVGLFSLLSNTEGNFNTAIGAGTLLTNTADENTATGAGALLSNTTGANNTANGAFALFSNTTGFNNNAVGNSALEDNSTGSNNTALGDRAGGSVTTANDVICIGAGVFGENVDNSCFIGNIWNQSGGSQAVYVNSEGKLGAQVSSRRFKDEIKPIKQASEVIFGLRPVSFRYKPEIEPTRPLGFGLIAEEVEKISPDLVTRSADGKAYTVRYDAVNAMLLNEFLKEHRKNEEQEATIARQQKQIEALTAGLQKVSSQLEISKPASRLARRDP
jgi:hypothetical protein